MTQPLALIFFERLMPGSQLVNRLQDMKYRVQAVNNIASLAATAQREQAADALLDIVRRNRTWNEDAARLQLLKFFEAWGFDDPATMAARRKLSAILFS